MTRLLYVVTALFLMVPLQSTAEVDIQELETSEGLALWLVEEPSIPMLSLEILIEGGGSLDPQGQTGVATFMMALLEEGAGDLDASAFAIEREVLAAQFSFSAERDSISISATMLAENADEAIELLRLAIAEPRFDESAVERIRSQIVSILQSSQTDPQDVASRAFFAQAFEGHPYAWNTEGELNDITAITSEDIRAAHRNLIVRDRVSIAMVGAVTEAEATRLTDCLLADLPLSLTPLPNQADIRLTGGVTVLPLPSPQSYALFGHTGIARDDPDFFPAFIMNHILGGGGFSSRLTTEVREERGLTYGVGTSVVPFQYGPLIIGSVSSDNNTIAEALEVIRAEWEQLAQNGVTAEELDAAQRYLTGAYPLRFSSNAAIAGIMVALQARDFPSSYVNTRNDQVNAVTVEDIARAAARIMRTDDLRFVVVGQPEGLSDAE